MYRALTALAGILVLTLAVACGSEEEGGNGGAGGQVADLSQFPTPTGSQDAPQAAPQGSQDERESDTAAEAPTQEEVQQLRARLRSGELSEGERQQVLQQLQSQGGGFGGGAGGGGFGGSQVVGTIEGVSGNTITVATDLASVTASLTDDTNISITSVLEPPALAEGAQVMVTGERVEGRTLARTIAIVLEGQGRFRGGQEQGGQGGALLLSGTVDDKTGNEFTLETQQGPLPITIDDETMIVQSNTGTAADLREGMQVRVSGQANEDGNIDARSVAVTPEGMDSLPGFGGGGGQGRGGPGNGT